MKLILSTISDAPTIRRSVAKDCETGVAGDDYGRPSPWGALLFQPVSLRLLAPGFNRFSPERLQWYNNAASGLYGRFLTGLRSLDDLME